MLFSEFLTELIDAALHIFHRSARQSEEFRKSHPDVFYKTYELVDDKEA